MHRIHTSRWRGISMTQRTVLTSILASLVLTLPAITQAAEPSQASHHPTSCESAFKKKPVPAKQLQAIMESHRQWLEQREKPEYQRADLCQADLRHAKLARADLERARLEGAFLSRPNGSSRIAGPLRGGWPHADLPLLNLRRRDRRFLSQLPPSGPRRVSHCRGVLLADWHDEGLPW